MAVLLWVVAALIVGSVIYLSALERTRDFAVLKAVGVVDASVLAGLCLQAVIVAVVAAVLGGLLSLVLGPLFPMRVVVPTSAFLLLPVIGVLIGLLASAAGMRRAVTIDPALAFGGREPWGVCTSTIWWSSTPAAGMRSDRLTASISKSMRGTDAAPRPERLRQDHAAVLPRRHPSPDLGRITIDDLDVTALDSRELTMYRRRTVGIVFQAFNLLASLTAIENVMVPMDAAGMNGRESRRARRGAAGAGRPRDRMQHRPGDLSGGQQQRVAVARAIALDPPLILADEPTAHLDFIQVEEVLRLIRELASGERLVVVATHDTRMLPLADRVVEMVPHVASTDRPSRDLCGSQPAPCCSSRARWATSSTSSAKENSTSSAS